MSTRQRTARTASIRRGGWPWLLGAAVLVGAAGSSCATALGDATATGGQATGGASGTGGTSGCASLAHCPAPPNACVIATCANGACGTQNKPEGVLMKNTPPDCHATTCDGAGHLAMGIDTTNVVQPTNPCLVGTCDAMGTPGTAPAAPGTMCAAAPNGKVCDGAGQCVQCLHDSDCALGETCAATHTCLASSCTDGVQDGNETDVDCGGACSACALGKACKVDADCATMACDALSLTCVSDPCADHRKDGAETDVDCGGGTCPACATGKGCALDSDCSSNACDGVSLLCVSNQCSDHRKDGLETDVDCGGGVCAGCAAGKTCLLDGDCGSNACDALSLTCVNNQCIDHQQDGNETDVDCGGANLCARCATGKKCVASSDCQVGHMCGTGTPHVCM